MPKCTDETRVWTGCPRVIRPAFDGGDIVSDGGMPLLKQVDERLGLTRSAALALGDHCRGATQRSQPADAAYPRSVTALVGRVRPHCDAPRSGDEAGFGCCWPRWATR